MEKKMKANTKDRVAFLAGMKRYRDQGVSIVIAGEEPDESAWQDFFAVREDGGFYMADYIFEDVESGEEPESEKIPEIDADVREAADWSDMTIVREASDRYGVKRRLKEIRFDLVYHE